jgi:hypothetical protein
MYIYILWDKHIDLRVDCPRFKLIYLINSNDNILTIISMNLRKIKIKIMSFTLYMQ